MNLFYSEQIEGNTAFLNESESHHALRVLKLHTGKNVLVGDGLGTIYHATVGIPDKKRLQLKLANVYSKELFQDRLHVAIGPTKSLDRFEFFLEKATEAGVDEITPLISFHSERKVYKTDRGRRIILSAAKQSLSHRLPLLHEPVIFRDFIEKGTSGQTFIAHCNNELPRKAISSINQSGSCTIMIGPEGDFSDEEIASATAKGITPITLGNKRLRTETAGIAVCLLKNLLIPQLNDQ